MKKTIDISLIIFFLFSSFLSASIYWNSSGGGIVRSNLDGTGVETVVYDSVHGIAVDPIHNRLYWNNPVERTMNWSRLNGSDIETINPSSGIGDMTLDLINEKIYWNSSGGGIVDPIHDRLYWNNPVDRVMKWSRLDGSETQIITIGTGSGAMALDYVYIPEPATLSLLAIGGLLMRRKKQISTTPSL